jgi:hypothetical protein
MVIIICACVCVLCVVLYVYRRKTAIVVYPQSTSNSANRARDTDSITRNHRGAEVYCHRGSCANCKMEQIEWGAWEQHSGKSPCSSLLLNVRWSSHATGSLWFRQSQQSFNTLTPFYFLCHSLHVSAPMGHLQRRHTIRYFYGLFLVQWIRCTYAIWCRDVICCTSVLWLIVLIHVIKLNKNCKISKILLKNRSHI